MEKKQSCYKRFLTLLIACNALLLVLLLLPQAIGGQVLTENLFLRNLFFAPGDRFSDFYNIAQYAMDRNLVNDNCASPPFIHLCGYVINQIVRFFWAGQLESMDGIFQLFGRTAPGYALWLCVVAAAILFLGWNCGKLLQASAWRGYAITVFAVLCSFPFLYAVDRGNYVLFAAIFMAATLADYEEHPYRAAVWLGIAAALKLYPALLGVLFLRDKRWKPAAACAATGAGLTLVSLGFFSTGASGFWVTVQDWLHKVQLYNKIGNDFPQELRTINELLLNNSMHTPFLFIENALHPEGGLQGILSATAWVGTASFVLLAVVMLLCLLLRKNHDVFLLCSLMMLVYPLNSGVYNLALMVVPLLYWCKNEPHNFWMPAAGLALLVSKTSINYCVVSPGVFLTLHGLFSAPLMLAMTAYVIWLRRVEWMGAVRDTVKWVQQKRHKAR